MQYRLKDSNTLSVPRYFQRANHCKYITPFTKGAIAAKPVHLLVFGKPPRHVGMRKAGNPKQPFCNPFLSAPTGEAPKFLDAAKGLIQDVCVILNRCSMLSTSRVMRRRCTVASVRSPAGSSPDGYAIESLTRPTSPVQCVGRNAVPVVEVYVCDVSAATSRKPLSASSSVGTLFSTFSFNANGLKGAFEAHRTDLRELFFRHNILYLLKRTLHPWTCTRNNWIYGDAQEKNTLPQRRSICVCCGII